jgi:hypothetical protein
MTAYVNGQWIDNAVLTAADLTEAFDNIPTAPNGVAGVGPIQPVLYPGLSLVGGVFTAAATGFGSGLSGGYAQASINPLPSSYPFTVEARVQGTVNGTKQVAAGYAFLFWFGCDNAGQAIGVAYPGSGEVDLTTSVNICDGSWHHLALVVTATTVSLYVDGALAGSATNTFVYNAALGCFGVRDWGQSASLPLGANGQPGPNRWAGSIDEVAIWPIAKYTAAFTPPTAPYAGTEGMTSLYHLDGTGLDSLAPLSVPIGTRPSPASGIRLLMKAGDSVTYTILPATSSATQGADVQFTASGSGTGPNWDEPFVSTLMMFVTAASGTPLFRWM